MQVKNIKCQADEYPPAAFWQGAVSPKQYIRFAPGGQNGGAGSLFKLGFCKYGADGKLPVESSNLHFSTTRVVGGLVRDVSIYFAKTTRSVVRIDFDAAVIDPDGIAGLQDNPCWPKVLLDDPGFALLTDDPYYQGAGRAVARTFAKSNYPDLIPSDVLLNNKPQTGFRKRNEDSHDLDPDGWVYDNGNSTRPLTDNELEEVGIIRCSSADCHDEMQALGIETAIVEQATVTGPPQVPIAIATTTHPATGVVATPVDYASAKGGIHGLLAQPRATGF
jgi:chitinase